jgi:hypothetical protein
VKRAERVRRGAAGGNESASTGTTFPPNPPGSLRICTGVARIKRLAISDAQAFDCLVAKGGIEPPTQGFSGRSDKRDPIINQAFATHATFREQRHKGWNESNEATKSYGVATVPIF